MADEGKKKYTSNELQRWLFEKASKASSPAIARKIVISNDQRGRSITMLNRLYFFRYNPKGRYTLPQYDKFPLCIPIERYSDGFLGLNLHYLPGAARERLLKMVLITQDIVEGADVTVMRVNYEMVQNVRRLNTLATPCIHRYLFSHVRSRFIEVYPSEYEMAIQLPTEDWVFNQ